jgi:squalene cyclase
VEHPNGRYQRESVQRAIDWILSMQCKNGGWASFDKDNDRMVFQYSVRRSQRHARSADGGHHGANSRMPGGVWLYNKGCIRR